MTTYIHLGLWRIPCKCNTSRKKTHVSMLLKDFMYLKKLHFTNNFFTKTLFSPNIKFTPSLRTIALTLHLFNAFHILHSYSFLPNPKLCPSIFYIPIYFSPFPNYAHPHSSFLFISPTLPNYFLPHSTFLLISSTLPNYALPHSTFIFISTSLPKHDLPHSTFLFISPALTSPKLCPSTFYIHIHFSPTPSP